MNIVDRVVLEHFARRADEDERFVGFAEKYNANRRLVRCTIILHLTKCIDYNTFRRRLASVFSKPEYKELRAAIVADFSLVVALKLAVMHYARERPASSREIFHRCGLHDHPVLLRALEKAGALDEIAKRIRDVELDGVLPQRLRRECEATAAKVRPSVASFVRKKMAFIVRHNNYEFNDFVNELLEHAVRSYYLSAPFKPPKHAENSMRLSAQNFGRNKIQYYQTERRRRLYNRGEAGYESTVVSLYRTVSSEGEPTMEVRGEVEKNAPENSMAMAYRNFEVAHSLAQVMRDYRRRAPNKLKAVKALLGGNDPDFAAFCRKKYKVCKDAKSVADIKSSVSRKRYEAMIRGYTEMSPESWSRFKGELRRCLV